MHVYISLPITGLDMKDVEQQSEMAKEKLKELGHTPLSPLDIVNDKDMPYSYCMGLDIMTLLECDAVAFLSGWEKSKGCKLEFNAAIIYNKVIIYHLLDGKENNNTDR